jgi:hypothetical protein
MVSFPSPPNRRKGLSAACSNAPEKKDQVPFDPLKYLLGEFGFSPDFLSKTGYSRPLVSQSGTNPSLCQKFLDISIIPAGLNPTEAKRTSP